MVIPTGSLVGGDSPLSIYHQTALKIIAAARHPPTSPSSSTPPLRPSVQTLPHYSVSHQGFFNQLGGTRLITTTMSHDGDRPGWSADFNITVRGMITDTIYSAEWVILPPLMK